MRAGTAGGEDVCAAAARERVRKKREIFLEGEEGLDARAARTSDEAAVRIFIL
jgi:hypothetical protein